MSLHCRRCSQEFDLKEAVVSTPYSWPELQAFWFVCRACGKGNHIRIEEGMAAVIDIIGAPGPDWEYAERFRIKEISFRSDPSVLHVFFGHECFSVDART